MDTRLFVESQTGSSLEETQLPRDQESSEVFKVDEGRSLYIPTALERNPYDLDTESVNRVGAYFFVARGATGKTALAKYISSRLRAPLWKTSQDTTINAHSLRVHLLDYTACHSIDELLEKESNPLVVVDSLDEAMVSVSSTTWVQFKKSIAKMATRGVKSVSYTHLTLPTKRIV